MKSRRIAEWLLAEEEEEEKKADSLTVGISADDKDAEEKDAEAGPKKGPPMEVQPLRSRRDYGAKNRDSGMCGCGCGNGPDVDDSWMTREEVAQFCGACAEKMARQGIKKVRKSVFLSAVNEVALKSAVQDFRTAKKK